MKIYTDKVAGYVNIESSGGRGNKGQDGEKGKPGAAIQGKVSLAS